MLTLLPMLAQAQTFTVLSDSVVPDPQGRGVGAPSVVWNGRQGHYQMFFETEVSAPGCDEAWAVRRATSVDGTSFTVVPGRIVGPSPTFACGARAPAAVLNDDGTFAVFFQALDGVSDDGVGVYTNVSGRPERRMIEDLRGIYEPTAARLDGTWSVMGVDPTAGVVVARSTDLVSFVFDAAPELANGQIPWAGDGFAMPALGCIDGTNYPWELYFGGWSGADAGWAWGVSSVAGAWYVTAPYSVWSDDSAWTSFDFVTDGDSTLVWFETTDASGVPQVGLSISGPGVAVTNLRDRDCAR